MQDIIFSTEDFVFSYRVAGICVKNGKVLLQKPTNDTGCAFPGGHVEPGESFVRSAIREVKEETGLDIENPRLCGIKQFYTKAGERYVVFFYKANRYTGALTSSDEGEVFWVSRDKLHTYPLVSDFMEMVKVFESDDLSEFYYYKENGEWNLALL